MPAASTPLAPVTAAIDAACDRIAPTWPLDQFIAVNPYWGWRQHTIAEAASQLAVLAGTSLTMPRTWFRSERAAGRIADAHLDAAADLLGDPSLASAARALLDAADEPAQPTLTRLGLVSDLRDLGDGPAPGRTWTETVVHQMGQHCASHVDQWQASWGPRHDMGLYGTWRVDPSVTHGIGWRRGSTWARESLEALPLDAAAAIAVVLDDLGVPEDGHEAYLTAALCSINGWAAWCAYIRWQARLTGGDDDTITELLAIRLTWEWLIHLDTVTEASGGSLPDLAAWARSWVGAPELAATIAREQQIDWVLQLAAERTHQDTIIAGLPTAEPDAAGAVPTVQAAFCIDVRSEVFRRALEASSPEVRTRGFAGFFGLPIAYSPAGSALTRPQLPGLLSPAMTVTEQADGAAAQAAVEGRLGDLAESGRWAHFRKDPASVFSFVESMGLLYGVKLVKDSLPHHHAPAAWEHEGLGDAAGALRPRLSLVDDDPAAAAAIGHRVLNAMGLVRDFPAVVLLCGHGSTSANNPHAAGLDCGACGGQTGEVNARVLADLLDSPAVRHEMRALGIDVPHTTWFVAGLHDTTLDEVTLFDLELLPPSHNAAVADLRSWLEEAGRRARAERAPTLGLGHLADDAAALERSIRERATDWSQVRPEWGLAGNAAFVVAPRWRTRHLDLQGRSFLHDYDWRLDTDLSVLTLIMTAPMVVTNWINMQYNASTVDNHRYGSGNKVLHNVVGGRLGVFEGNGGDLRIGLSEQSLHDGTELRHRPLRLSVFIEAPRDAIDGIISEHAVVSDLVLNGWLHLLRIDSETGEVERRTTAGWTPAVVAT